jgi:hypothetical protein
VLMDRVDLGLGTGGYRFRIERVTTTTSTEGKRFQEIVRPQAQPQEKESQHEGEEAPTKRSLLRDFPERSIRTWRFLTANLRGVCEAL